MMISRSEQDPKQKSELELKIINLRNEIETIADKIRSSEESHKMYLLATYGGKKHRKTIENMRRKMVKINKEIKSWETLR